MSAAARRVDTRQVRRNFAAHAQDYDRYAVVQKQVVHRLIERMSPERIYAGYCLDVGTGTGMLTQKVLNACPQLKPVLSDLAHGMSAFASNRLGGVPAVDADAQMLPFRDGSFSLVCSSSVYQWMNDLSRAFSESARVLADEGIFAFALFGQRTLFELKESHRRASGDASHFQQFPGLRKVRHALCTAGFSHVEVWEEDLVEYHPDVPTLLRSLKGIGAQNAASDRPAGLASRRVMLKMMDSYVKQFGVGGKIPATYHVVYGLARKGAG